MSNKFSTSPTLHLRPDSKARFSLNQVVRAAILSYAALMALCSSAFWGKGYSGLAVVSAIVAAIVAAISLLLAWRGHNRFIALVWQGGQWSLLVSRSTSRRQLVPSDDSASARERWVSVEPVNPCVSLPGFLYCTFDEVQTGSVTGSARHRCWLPVWVFPPEQIRQLRVRLRLAGCF